MAKYLVVLFLVLCALECALCLECYTTDLTSLSTAGELKNKKQDCHQYIESLLRLQGVSRPVPSNIVFKCYTVVVETASTDVTVKGCIPEGGCGLMKSMMKSMVESASGVNVENVKCNECGSNDCN